LRVVHTRK
jgi:hypothetical protein